MTRTETSFSNTGRSPGSISCGGSRPVRCGAVPDGDQVTGPQRPAAKSADPAEPVGGTAAQDHRHVDASMDGNIEAGPALEDAEGDLVAGVQFQPRPLSSRPAIDFDIHRRAGDRDDRRIIGTELRAHIGALQHSFSRGCSGQRVGHLRRQPVHRAALRDADIVVPEAALVLDRCGQARFKDLKCH